MLKQMLEKEGIKLKPEELAVVLEMTQDDIRFNRIGFGKTTSTKEFIQIACRCSAVFMRC